MYPASNITINGDTVCHGSYNLGTGIRFTGNGNMFCIAEISTHTFALSGGTGGESTILDIDGILMITDYQKSINIISGNATGTSVKANTIYFKNTVTSDATAVNINSATGQVNITGTMIAFLNNSNASNASTGSHCILLQNAKIYGDIIQFNSNTGNGIALRIGTGTNMQNTNNTVIEINNQVSSGSYGVYLDTGVQFAADSVIFANNAGYGACGFYGVFI